MEEEEESARNTVRKDCDSDLARLLHTGVAERCERVHISLPVFTIPKRDGTSHRPFDERSRPFPALVLPGLAAFKAFVLAYNCFSVVDFLGYFLPSSAGHATTVRLPRLQDATAEEGWPRAGLPFQGGDPGNLPGAGRRPAVHPGGVSPRKRVPPPPRHLRQHRLGGQHPCRAEHQGRGTVEGGTRGRCHDPPGEGFLPGDGRCLDARRTSSIRLHANGTSGRTRWRPGARSSCSIRPGSGWLCVGAGAGWDDWHRCGSRRCPFVAASWSRPCWVASLPRCGPCRGATSGCSTTMPPRSRLMRTGCWGLRPSVTGWSASWCRCRWRSTGQHTCRTSCSTCNS